MEVFIASASSRVVKSLEAYDLLEDVGGLPLVTLEIVDVFWAVLEDLGMYVLSIIPLSRAFYPFYFPPCFSKAQALMQGYPSPPLTTPNLPSLPFPQRHRGGPKRPPAPSLQLRLASTGGASGQQHGRQWQHLPPAKGESREGDGK